MEIFLSQGRHHHRHQITLPALSQGQRKHASKNQSASSPTGLLQLLPLLKTAIHLHSVHHNRPGGSTHVLLVSGIASSAYMIQYVADMVRSLEVMDFTDHHQFTMDDLIAIKNHFDSTNLQKK